MKDSYGKRDELVKKLASLARDIGEAIDLLNGTGLIDLGRFESDIREYAE